MKQILLLATFLFSGLLIQAQYINNAGFETWTTVGSYENPTGWQTPNSFTSGFGAITVTKDAADFNSGMYSTKLETKNIFGYNVSGILTNGTISVNLSATPPASIKGGTPFTQRPTYFKGYYKYTPATGDACIMNAFLLKWNPGTGKADTIGYANFSNTSAISSWTLFEATFTYSSADIPDTMQICVYSSNPLAAVATSVLKVDDLFLEGGMSVNKVNLFKNISIFPNPSTDIINILFNSETKSTTTVTLYSLVGQKVKEISLPLGTELSNINVRSLNKGMYFICIQSGKDKFTQKISIE